MQMRGSSERWVREGPYADPEYSRAPACCISPKARRGAHGGRSGYGDLYPYRDYGQFSLYVCFVLCFFILFIGYWYQLEFRFLLL